MPSGHRILTFVIMRCMRAQQLTSIQAVCWHDRHRAASSDSSIVKSAVDTARVVKRPPRFPECLLEESMSSPEYEGSRKEPGPKLASGMTTVVTTDPPSHSTPSR